MSLWIQNPGGVLFSAFVIQLRNEEIFLDYIKILNETEI